MLIRSQSKRALINLGRVNSLTVSQTGEEKYSIRLQSELRGTIGEYESEQRAIEVLDEICNAYQYCNECAVFGIGATQPEFVFQMPEE